MKKNKATRVNPKAVGRPRKIGAAPGFGPRHAENAKEGEDLTQQNTDTVPAMLTPREAVLNRNAAEMAGRGRIEKLNAEGNELAKKGVDLAGGGTSDMKEKAKKYQGGAGAVPGQKPWGPMPANQPQLGGRVIGGGPTTSYQGPALGSAGWQETHPDFGKNFYQNKNTGDWEHKFGGVSGSYGPPQAIVGGDPYGPGVPGVVIGGGMPGYGGQPHAGGGPGLGGGGMPGAYGPPMLKKMPGASFYPQGQGIQGLQGGTGELSAGPGIGANWAPAPPVGTAPDISKLLQQVGKEQGLSASQIAGLTKAFQSFGGGGADSLQSGGYGTSPLEASGGFQGGISDIGYPPSIGPSMQYHADKGSSWVGPYDPAFLVERYARGTSDVPFR